jgi:hypothetical protein
LTNIFTQCSIKAVKERRIMPGENLEGEISEANEAWVAPTLEETAANLGAPGILAETKATATRVFEGPRGQKFEFTPAPDTGSGFTESGLRRSGNKGRGRKDRY